MTLDGTSGLRFTLLRSIGHDDEHDHRRLRGRRLGRYLEADDPAGLATFRAELAAEYRRLQFFAEAEAVR